MASYHTFLTTRPTRPDGPGLLAALRSAVAPELGFVMLDEQQVLAKKTAPWTPADIATTQQQIDTFAAQTPQNIAQRVIDAMSIADKARDLALIDQLNVIRAALPVPKADITPAQAIAAIRAKAATL